MNCANPRITVLMPVYNGEKYLAEAIESILNQTYTDFLFLIINDGSSDGSIEIIRRYHDPRIRLVCNVRHKGLVAVLNQGIVLTQSEYIARMDCDDISFPERLATQVGFMDQHPEVGVCGTWGELTDPPGYIHKVPMDHESITAGLLSFNQLLHNSVMIRMSVLRTHHLYYDAAFPYAEDYELWVRMAKVTRLANIPEVLVIYRTHPHQVSREFFDEQQNVGRLIQMKQLNEVKQINVENRRNRLKARR